MGMKALRALLGALCFGYAVLVAAACSAATIEPIQGDLSVNQGQGFQKVDSRIDANVGDMVMVSPNGSATVSYPDGCHVNVQPGAVMTIAPLSPCASGSYAQDQSGSLISGNPTAGLIIGAGAAGLVGFGIYEALQKPPPPPPPPPAPASP